MTEKLTCRITSRSNIAPPPPELVALQNAMSLQAPSQSFLRTPANDNRGSIQRDAQ